MILHDRVEQRVAQTHRSSVKRTALVEARNGIDQEATSQIDRIEEAAGVLSVPGIRATSRFVRTDSSVEIREQLWSGIFKQTYTY